VTDYNGFGTASPPGNPGTSPATLSWQNDSGAYTFGQTFTVDTTGLSATKVRWYIPSGSPSAPTTGYYVALYEVGNSTPVASAGPVGATVGAWNEQAITPVALTSGAEYRSAVLFPGGYYGAQSPNAMPYDPAGPISFPSTGRFESGGTLVYPNQASGSSPWYGIDVTVSDAGPAGQDGTGSATGPAGTAAGTGGITYAGTGAPAGPAGAASGAGGITYAGTGTAVGVAGAASGVGAQPFAGTGSAAGPAGVGSGAGTGPVASSGASAAATALAALWFTESVQIERFAGQTGYGPTFGTPTTQLAAIDHGAREVRTITGEAKVSTARVFLPLPQALPLVPVGSRVTLPAEHGGENGIVLERHVHSSGVGTPNHLELVLT
jgi:hypothetical protein